MKLGFCNVWVTKRRPCMITPELDFVAFTAKGDIPCLDAVDIEEFMNATLVRDYGGVHQQGKSYRYLPHSYAEETGQG